MVSYHSIMSQCLRGKYPIVIILFAATLTIFHVASNSTQGNKNNPNIISSLPPTPNIPETPPTQIPEERRPANIIIPKIPEERGDVDAYSKSILLEMEKMTIASLREIKENKSPVKIGFAHNMDGYYEYLYPESRPSKTSLTRPSWQQGDACEVDCTFAKAYGENHKTTKKYDAILWNTANCKNSHVPKPAPESPLIIMMHLEPEAHMQFPECFVEGGEDTSMPTSDVDLVSSSHSNASVWSSYMYNVLPVMYIGAHGNPGTYKHIRDRKYAKSACAFISRCKDWGGRLQYIETLSKYVPIRHYGGCNRNARTNLPKVEELKECGAYLAFENSMLHDYVTEKFYQVIIPPSSSPKALTFFLANKSCFLFGMGMGITQGFETGAIMVYRGAPNVMEEYSPAPSSFLNAPDFKDADELGALLKELL